MLLNFIKNKFISVISFFYPKKHSITFSTAQPLPSTIYFSNPLEKEKK